MTITTRLTAYQQAVLTALATAEPVTATQLATLLGMNKATVAGNLSRLEELGLACSRYERSNCKYRFYMLGLDPNEADSCPAQQLRSTSWVPHHHRDPLVAALFGEARTA